MATKDDLTIQILSNISRTVGKMHTHMAMTDDFMRSRFINPPAYPIHQVEQEVMRLEGQIASLQHMSMDNEYHVGLLHKED